MYNMGNPIKSEILNAAISDFLSGRGIAKTCKKHGLSPETFRKYLKIKNISLRGNKKLKVDDSYFSNINNEEKAYFLGLLMADGCINKKKKLVSLSLSGDEDKYILEKLKEVTKFSGEIREKKVNYDGAKKHFRIDIYSEQMLKDVESYGITERKSLTCDLTSKFPLEFIRPFFRGLFDGDGSVSIKKDGSVCCSLIGSIPMINNLGSIYKEDYKLNFFIEEVDNNYVIKFGGHFSTFCFLNWIYEDASIYLNRKYNKYLTIKEQVIHKLNNLHEVYSAWASFKENINKSAEILKIDISDYDGCSLTKEEQEKVISIFNSVGNVKKTCILTGYSKTLINRILDLKKIPRPRMLPKIKTVDTILQNLV